MNDQFVPSPTGQITPQVDALPSNNFPTGPYDNDTQYVGTAQDFQGEHVEIAWAVFIETGTHNDITLRPYETQLTGNLIDEFREVTEDGRNFAPSILSSTATQFLRPSTQHQGFAQIENGWGESRLRFMMAVDYFSNNGNLISTKILQGYTNHVGVTPSGAVDQNMLLYFNTVLALRYSAIQTPSGFVNQPTVASANHLLTGHVDYNMMQGKNASTRLMRPEDVFSTIHSQSLDSSDFLDTRSTFMNDGIVKSRRRNNNAPFYVSSTVSAYRRTFDQADDMDAWSDMCNQAKGYVKEDTMARDKFFHQLRQNSHSFMSKNAVTYGEMCGLYPEFDHRCQIVMLKKFEQVSHQQNRLWGATRAGDSEYWTSSTNETIWSSILCQSVPSLMFDLMLSQVEFIATNRTLDGSFWVQAVGGKSFIEGLDIRPYVEQFEQRLEYEVLRGLSSNNALDFDLKMMADVTGDTRLSISIGGQPAIEYSAPSYCDARFTPVLTQDQKNMEAVAYDISELSSNFGTHQSASASRQFLPTEDYNDSII